MSPIRPISGVATDALRRYEVSTQLTEFSEVCSACWIPGSAGATSDCSSAYDTPPRARTASVMPGCWRSSPSAKQSVVAERRPAGSDRPVPEDGEQDRQEQQQEQELRDEDPTAERQQQNDQSKEEQHSVVLL